MTKFNKFLILLNVTSFLTSAAIEAMPKGGKKGRGGKIGGENSISQNSPKPAHTTHPSVGDAAAQKLVSGFTQKQSSVASHAPHPSLDATAEQKLVSGFTQQQPSAPSHAPRPSVDDAAAQKLVSGEAYQPGGAASARDAEGPRDVGRAQAGPSEAPLVLEIDSSVITPQHADENSETPAPAATTPQVQASATPDGAGPAAEATDNTPASTGDQNAGANAPQDQESTTSAQVPGTTTPTPGPEAATATPSSTAQATGTTALTPDGVTDTATGTAGNTQQDQASAPASAPSSTTQQDQASTAGAQNAAAQPQQGQAALVPATSSTGTGTATTTATATAASTSAAASTKSTANIGATTNKAVPSNETLKKQNSQQAFLAKNLNAPAEIIADAASSTYNDDEIADSFQDAASVSTTRVNAANSALNARNLTIARAAAIGAGEDDRHQDIWFETRFSKAKQKKYKNYSHYNLIGKEFTLGYNLQLNDLNSTGISLSYADNHFKLPQLHFNNYLKAQSYQLTLYGSHKFANNLQALLSLNGGITNNYNYSHRLVNNVQPIKSKYKIYNGSLGLTLSKNYYANNLLLTPDFSAVFTKIYQEKFSEYGNNKYRKQVSDNESDFVDLSIGTKIAKTLNYKNLQVTPELHGRVNYQAAQGANKLTVKFADETASNFVGPKEQKLSYNIGTSVSLKNSEQADLVLKYDYSFKEKYFNHQFVAKLTYNL